MQKMMTREHSRKGGRQKAVSALEAALEKLSLESKDEEDFELERTGVIYNESMVEHRCLWDPDYPENPERFTRVLERCKELKLLDRCKMFQSRAATEKEILALHSKEYLNLVKTTKDSKDDEFLETLSSKFDSVYFHPRTLDLALLAAGSTIELVSAIIEGKVKNGMAIVRPPGHHAMKSEACGYCFFNNVALAAKHAIAKHHLKRILIVDWDVHHGQGTQYMFYNDPRVLYFSIHRYEHGSFWPELRESNFDFIGTGPGRGKNINVPLNQTGMKNGDYLAIFHNILLPVAYEFDPQLVLVSAGYDAAIGCFEGEMNLTPSVYAHLLHPLMALARGKVCVVLEGGYCLPSLAESAAMTLRELLGDCCPNIGPCSPPVDSAVETIMNVITFQRPFWKSLAVQGVYTDKLTDSTSGRPRYRPSVKYKGSLGLRKPEAYETRQCYIVQTPETKTEFERRIRSLIASTDLSVPPRRTCLVFDQKMMQHQNMIEKKHVEKPDRISSIFSKLQEQGLVRKCQVLESRYATDEELLLVHKPEYIRSMKMTEGSKPHDLAKKEMDYTSVYICPATYQCALLATGCLLQVVDSVMSRKTRNGVAIIRPPGHHAESGEASGFCIFNSVAVAAHYALKQYNLQRILILDWDVHHGNGIQHAFYEDPRVLYISLHCYDDGSFFPYNSDANFDAVGEKEGIGYNINIPWNKKKMSDGDYLSAFFHIVLPVAYEFDPELVVVSAGFDAAKGDPLGGYGVSPEAYGHMTHQLMALANGKLILALEGGYNLSVISEAMSHCTSVLLGEPPLRLKKGLHPNESAVETIRNVMRTQKKYWKCLRFDADLPTFPMCPEDMEDAQDNLEKTSSIEIPSSSDEFIDQVGEAEMIKTESVEQDEQDEELEGACGLQISRDPLPGMYCVVPLDWCPHLALLPSELPPEGIDITVLCPECGETKENWVCLHCFEVRCGRYINEHMLLHGLENDHYLTLSFSDLSVWCYQCDSYVHNEVLLPAKRHVHRKKFSLDMPT